MYLEEQTYTIGKLGVALTEAEVCAIYPSSRLCVTDRKSGLRFLVDTGANVSVIPKSILRKKCQDHTYKLFAANGTEINTYGDRTLTLDLNMRRPYTWTFIVADITQPILGADFLSQHNIMVDIKNKKLVDGKTGLLTPVCHMKSTTPTLKTINLTNPYADLLNKYPNITKPINAMVEPKHNVVHQIITTGHPVYSKCRPLPADKYKLVKKEIEHMLEAGICRPSKSPWASPLHVTKKKNGDLRLCGDYRRLNAITVPDRYPVPRILDFTYILNNTSIYTRIDLTRAYNQIPVQEVEKTAIITPMGLYEFPRMPFGLRNAGQTFVRFLNSVLAGLDFVFTFIDDILVASKSEQEHRCHLNEIFKRLDENGIAINQAKCEFGKPEVEFLGYLVSKEGIKPVPNKMEAITKYPKPETIQELRRFLGMVNFYRKNIPHAAKYQATLNKYLSHSKKNDKTKIQWSKESENAFEQCKVSLTKAVTLSSPSPDVPLSLMTDASQSCVGAVLQQFMNGKWQPISFFSKSLSDTQIKYSTYDRELLAIYMAVNYFQHHIMGREIIIYTDHKPLCHAYSIKNNNVNEKLNPRRLRHLEYISQFTTDIRHLAGNMNPVADALSRIHQIDCPSPIDWKEIANKQANDTQLKQYITENKYNWKSIQLDENLKLYCENSQENLRPFVPNDFRKQVFDTMHGVSHPGIRSTRKIITSHFFWPNMNKDVSLWAKTCLSCQKSKINKHNSAIIGSFPNASRLEHVHMDIVGPLTISGNNRYILTMIDRATRWPEAVPVPEITADVVARAFVDNWVARYGCPAVITTDRGPQFESNLFIAIAKILGIHKIRTTSYHPQSNGLIERWHRTLKTAIMARGNTSSWHKELAIVLLGIRSTLSSDTNVTPAQMLYGTNIRIPGEFFEPSKPSTSPETYAYELQRMMAELSPHHHTHHSCKKSYVHPCMKTCEYVFVRRDYVKKPLITPYEGPYKVLKKYEKFYKVQLLNKSANISIDRLKPAFVSQDIEFNDQSTHLKMFKSTIVHSKEIVQKSADSPDNTKTTRSGRIVRPVVRFAN